MPIPALETLSPDATRRLNGMVTRLVGGLGVRHAILAVARSDGSPLWLGATGAADGGCTRMTADTPYFLASVTKLYIATGILRLMEQGRVSLDAGMAAYLPQELVHRLHVWRGKDQTGEITLRHLLGHAAGLPDYLVIRPPGGTSLFEAAAAGAVERWGIGEIADLVREHGRPDFPPRPFDGRRHTIRYSDTNFQFLIAVIEAVTGASLQAAFDDLIFRRLGLSHTFLPATPAAASATPAPAAVWLGDRRLDTLTGAMASFNDLFGTAGDQLRFMAALVSGAAFDDPATARLMTAHWNPLAFSLNPRPVGPGWPMEYGLGTIRYRLPRLLTPLRPMPELVGHTGVTGSWLFHCPELGIITAGTVDQATAAATPYRLMPRLLDLLRREMSHETPFR
ncbi:class A beta-lactamase-related serine hydrolase [Rhodovulum sp. 12E13]|uniref:serine hydrolase domain-containing protein n=1 Tax=Rhodovulum sp. 12E13 TaxID=2203891 RepID=UPI000E14B8DF|nr:serine hydrolase domain-containing protein [Rhodovulum sp. 12E13]RDC69695.1 class A beta-lactamase-related serine hydrolase [Rhodovulum sp. 12E13]